MVGADLAPHVGRLERHGLAKAAGLSSIWRFVLADQFTVGFEKRPEDIERARTEINLVSVAQH